MNIKSIQTKEEIQEALNEAFDDVIGFIRAQDRLDFETTKAEGKWSTGQQLEHLIKSIRPVNKGMGLPKFLLRWKFGKLSREEMMYNELAQKYQELLDAGGKSTAPYIPKVIFENQKEQLLSIYEKEKIKLLTILEKWNERQLSSLVAPHPLLGIVTIRELMFFTVFHNYHHLENIRNIA